MRLNIYSIYIIYEISGNKPDKTKNVPPLEGPPSARSSRKSDGKGFVSSEVQVCTIKYQHDIILISHSSVIPLIDFIIWKESGDKAVTPRGEQVKLLAILENFAKRCGEEVKYKTEESKKSSHGSSFTVTCNFNQFSTQKMGRTERDALDKAKLSLLNSILDKQMNLELKGEQLTIDE